MYNTTKITTITTRDNPSMAARDVHRKLTLTIISTSPQSRVSQAT